MRRTKQRWQSVGRSVGPPLIGQAGKETPLFVYVSMNKQRISFQNCFGIFSRLGHGKGQKYFVFLKLPSAPASRREQHVAGELLVVHACNMLKY